MISFRSALGVFCTTSTLIGCGGGSDANSSEPTVHAQTATLASSVLIQGCVLDEHYIPKAAAVRALSADGRIVNTVYTDLDGGFSISVPTNETVTVSIDKPGGDRLSIPVGTDPRTVGACLLD